jgi:hypothetical protein
MPTLAATPLPTKVLKANLKDGEDQTFETVLLKVPAQFKTKAGTFKFVEGVLKALPSKELFMDSYRQPGLAPKDGKGSVCRFCLKGAVGQATGNEPAHFDEAGLNIDVLDCLESVGFYLARHTEDGREDAEGRAFVYKNLLKFVSSTTTNGREKEVMAVYTRKLTVDDYAMETYLDKFFKFPQPVQK